jgi:hypothetical protein
MNCDKDIAKRIFRARLRGSDVERVWLAADNIAMPRDVFDSLVAMPNAALAAVSEGLDPDWYRKPSTREVPT